MMGHIFGTNKHFVIPAYFLFASHTVYPICLRCNVGIRLRNSYSLVHLIAHHSAIIDKSFSQIGIDTKRS